MRAFQYANPETKEKAVRLLQEKNGEAAVLAGGTDLLSLMKNNVVSPSRLINIKSILELNGVSYDAEKGLRIGALVTIDQLLSEDQKLQIYPSIRQAAEGIHSPQIRAMGTVGGELCQQPRCWYYRNGFGLLAMQNMESMVIHGDNRYHAVLGNSGPAYFVNPSSLAPALIALGAKINLFGPNGSRTVLLKDLYVIPKKEGERELSLQNSEIVTDIFVPPSTNWKNATYEIRQKEALDWPLATAAVSLETKGNIIDKARIVMGHVAPIPWRAPDAENYLTGQKLNKTIAERAGKIALKGAKALSRNNYKIQLGQVAVKRALLRAAVVEV